MTTEQTRQPLSFDEFRQVLVEVLRVSPARTVPEAHFVGDLGVDSIRMVELILRMEELGLEIPTHAVWEIQTVGDAYNYYRDHITDGEGDSSRIAGDGRGLSEHDG